MAKDYYKILGVDKKATDKDIKSAYKKMALKYHPDRQGDKSEAEKKAAEEKFKEVGEAYQVLSDQNKRKQYDMFGTTDFSFGSGGMSMEEAMFSFMNFGGMGNFFGGGKPKNHVQKGGDIRLRVKITSSELYKLYKGGTKTVTYTKKVKCEKCNGTGSNDGRTHVCQHCGGSGMSTSTMRKGNSIFQQIQTCEHCGGKGSLNTNPCEHCGGSGTKAKQETITIVIPCVDEFNNTVKYAGKGHESTNGNGINGDLYVIYEFTEEDGFDVDGHFNFVKEIEVPILDCLIGSDVKIKHLDGEIMTVKINPMTKEGDTVRVSGKGLKSKRSNGYCGDLILLIKTTQPKTVSDSEIEILKEAKKKLGW